MPRVTMLFGGLLIALGLYGFLSTGSTHPTALIPAYFGAILLVCGIFANTAIEKRRALWMHIAVTIGLLGFLLPLVRILGHWTAMPGPAKLSMGWMAGLCFAFTALCVRSFIAARVLRKA